MQQLQPLRVWRTRWILLGAAALAWVTSGPSPSAHGSSLRRTAVVKAVADVRPSVVNIHGKKSVGVATNAHFAVGDSVRQVNGMGTGIIIDERGYVLTNYHVVEGVGRIQITLCDRTSLVAELVANDIQTDLALLKIQTDQPLPVVKIGHSCDLMPGESVIAVGNAYGYENTVTTGIISALHRSVQVSDEQKYYNLIQTDASINPGNSGGPLLNIDGELIGINVAVRVGAQGIGFAIPIDEAMEAAARLLSLERIENLTHGVQGETVIDAEQSRFVVKSVIEGSPAARAGIQAGDVILSVNGHPIDRTLDFERRMVGQTPGSPISIEVDRQQQRQKVELALDRESHPETSFTERVWQELGVKLTPVPPSVFREYQSRYRGGLKVVAVRENGPAARQGVKRGDVLVGMHKWETTSMDNVAYILDSDEFRQTQPFKFYLLRGGETLFGTMRMD